MDSTQRNAGVARPPAPDAAHTREVAQFQLRVEATLALVLRVLQAEDIGVLTLKGAHLGQVYYDDPGEREYVDLDLLVRPAQFVPAVGALERAGFTRLPATEGRSATEQGYYCYTLVSPYAVPVEVHRAFAAHGRYPIDVEALFGRAVPFRVGGVETRGLDPEDLLCHLCIHAAKSDFFFMARKHVRDVERVVRQGTVDWEVVVGRVKRSGSAAGAFYLLTAACRQHGAVIPATVLESLRPIGVRRWWLDRHLDPSAFPIYRFGQHRTAQVQWRLTFPLIDSPWRWPGVAWRYARVRALDWTSARFPADTPEQRESSGS